MNRATWFNSKWKWLKRFALAAGFGLSLFVAGIFFDMIALTIFGALLLIPFIFWLALVPILHWKERYIGDNSSIWGAFLVFETSSWSKVFYWFFHVLPDWRRSGQYRDAL